MGLGDIGELKGCSVRFGGSVEVGLRRALERVQGQAPVGLEDVELKGCPVRLWGVS